MSLQNSCGQPHGTAPSAESAMGEGSGGPMLCEGMGMRGRGSTELHSTAQPGGRSAPSTVSHGVGNGPAGHQPRAPTTSCCQGWHSPMLWDPAPQHRAKAVMTRRRRRRMKGLPPTRPPPSSFPERWHPLPNLPFICCR